MFASGKGMRTLKRAGKKTYFSLLIQGCTLNSIGLRFHRCWSPCWEKNRNHWAYKTESNQMDPTFLVFWRFSEMMLKPSPQPLLWQRETNCLCSQLPHDTEFSWLLESKLSHSLHMTQPSFVFIVHLVTLNPLIHHLTKICSLPLFKVVGWFSSVSQQQWEIDF